MYFDFIARIARQYRSMRLVYAVYNVSRPLFTPALIDIHDGEPDPEDPMRKTGSYSGSLLPLKTFSRILLRI